MSDSGTRIALKSPSTGALHKVTKISPLPGGGFSLLMPYHPARSGFLAKSPIDYKQVGALQIPQNEMVSFTADDRIKLSYHADGFAQFSGEVQGKVISGRDATTGEPKGLGLVSQPISAPIKTGPTCALTVWGLEQYDLAETVSKSILSFGEPDWYFRACTPKTATAWVIEFFVFPNRYWAATRKQGDKYVLSLCFPGFEAGMGVIELAVIELPKQPLFIGAFVSRCKASFPTASGWCIAGPGTCDANGVGHVLHAFYPREGMDITTSVSLNREQQTANKGSQRTPDPLRGSGAAEP